MNLYKVYREDEKTGKLVGYLPRYIICARTMKSARDIARKKNEGWEISTFIPTTQKLGKATDSIREGIVLVGE